MIQRFLHADSGAVTVDWVVLTAATVGLGIASAGAVRLGTSDLGASIGAALSNAATTALGTLNARTSTFDDGDFTGWSVARTGFSPILGHFLGPFAGSEAALTNQVVLPEGATSASITFDLLLLDSWDATSPIHSDVATGGRGDGIAFMIDGVEIGFSAMGNSYSSNPTGTFEVNGATYTYAMTRTGGGEWFQPEHGGGNWPDARWAVTVTATNPPAGGFQLGINGTSNSHVTDESFGVDNYRVSYTNG